MPYPAFLNWPRNFRPALFSRFNIDKMHAQKQKNSSRFVSFAGLLCFDDVLIVQKYVNPKAFYPSLIFVRQVLLQTNEGSSNYIFLSKKKEIYAIK